MTALKPHPNPLLSEAVWKASCWTWFSIFNFEFALFCRFRNKFGM